MPNNIRHDRSPDMTHECVNSSMNQMDSVAEATKAMAKDTQCVHAGRIIDPNSKGLKTPLYPSNSHLHLEMGEDTYPRHSNTLNQRAVARKLCSLEHGELALVFSSGMAAISTALLASLSAGDHLVLQRGVYSGTVIFVIEELAKRGITASVTNGVTREDFEHELNSHTKAVFIESPTLPYLETVDIDMVADFAKSNGLISFIDNTIATPINQNPLLHGIDIVLHSASKFLGGHGDISAGVAIGKANHIRPMSEFVNIYGGCLCPQMSHMLERSIETLSLRMEKINHNAMTVADFLNSRTGIKDVYYPGITGNSGHETALKQMHGFGGIVSFILDDDRDPILFQRSFNLIQPANSMGELATTVNSPLQASSSTRKLQSKNIIKRQIPEGLIRMSVGIESSDDILNDLELALSQ